MGEEFDMATTTAEMEKVVRKVLDEELGDDSAATLKGIQRVTRLLTDQVIPKLSDSEDEEESTPTKPSATRAARAAPGKPVPDKPGKPEIPDKPPSNGNLPEGSVEALEELHSSLSPEQSKALASFFTAISSEPDEEEGETDEGGVGARFAGLSEVAKTRAAEFQAAVDALTPYVAEGEDGTFTLAAPKRVIREIDEDIYNALADSLEEANQAMRGAPAGAVGARMAWGVIIRLVLRMCIKYGKKIPWHKVVCAVSTVRRNQHKYPGNPPEPRWVQAAARDVIARCR